MWSRSSFKQHFLRIVLRIERWGYLKCGIIILFLLIIDDTFKSLACSWFVWFSDRAIVLVKSRLLSLFAANTVYMTTITRHSMIRSSIEPLVEFDVVAAAMRRWLLWLHIGVQWVNICVLAVSGLKLSLCRVIQFSCHSSHLWIIPHLTFVFRWLFIALWCDVQFRFSGKFWRWATSTAIQGCPLWCKRGLLDHRSLLVVLLAAISLLEVIGCRRITVRILTVQSTVQSVYLRMRGVQICILGRCLHRSEQDDVISVWTLL